MRTLLITLLTLTSTFLNAQRAVTWIGGTPGRETNWDEARNWNNQRVPDEFSDVIIPDVSTTTFSSPVITSGKFEVNAIHLASNAHLTVLKNAELVVYGNTVGLVNQNVQIDGSLVINDAQGEKTIYRTVVAAERNAAVLPRYCGLPGMDR